MLKVLLILSGVLVCLTNALSQEGEALSITVDYDPQYLALLKIHSPENANLHDQYGLLIPYFTIVNNSEKRLRIKDIRMEYIVEGRVTTSISLELATYPHERSRWIKYYLPNNRSVAIGGFVNVSEKLKESKSLKRGWTFSGGAFFPISTNDREELLRACQSVKLIIVDNRGNKNETSIQNSYLLNDPPIGTIRNLYSY